MTSFEPQPSIPPGLQLAVRLRRRTRPFSSSGGGSPLNNFRRPSLASLDNREHGAMSITVSEETRNYDPDWLEGLQPFWLRVGVKHDDLCLGALRHAEQDDEGDLSCATNDVSGVTK